MVITADFAAFQQQLRQEMADVIQQLRVEVNESVSGRMDMLNSISTALQNVSAKPTDSKPYRIDDLLPRNWEGSNDKGEFRSFMSDLHLWMHRGQTREKKLVSVESTDRFDSSSLAFDCSDDEIRSIEASLYQVLDRTTANEQLRICNRQRDRRVSKHGVRS